MKTIAQTHQQVTKHEYFNPYSLVEPKICIQPSIKGNIIPEIFY